MRRIYLDHNATTPLDPRVFEAMRPWLTGRFGNPSSLHEEGREARRAVEDAREQVAALIGADPAEIVFTSGATEANAWAVDAAVAVAGEAARRLIVTAIEHPSILEPAAGWRERGAEVEILPVDDEGRLRLETLDAALRRPAALVAVMAANNEVGTIQPWREAARRAAAAGTRLHVDAVQAVVKAGFDVRDLAAATASLSAHKIGGPKGAGALFVRRDLRVPPLLRGGGQERERRAGTENVAAIVGFGAASRLATEEAGARRTALARAEREFLDAVRAEIPDLVLHGAREPSLRIPGTLSLRVPTIKGERLLVGADLCGLSISVGSACSSGAAQPSHVLSAMGITKAENLESVRVSLGWNDRDDELAEAARLFVEVVRRNRAGAGS